MQTAKHEEFFKRLRSTKGSRQQTLEVRFVITGSNIFLFEQPNIFIIKMCSFIRIYSQSYSSFSNSPSSHLLNWTENQSSICGTVKCQAHLVLLGLFRIPHPRLSSSNQANRASTSTTVAPSTISSTVVHQRHQPPLNSNGVASSSGRPQTQYRPSAPPSPSPLGPSSPWPTTTAGPRSLAPQDPRLPSLYLPSYDEAVNMGWNEKLEQKKKNWHIWIKDRWESSGHIVKLAKLERSEELTQQNAPEKTIPWSLSYFF